MQRYVKKKENAKERSPFFPNYRNFHSFSIFPHFIGIQSKV